MGNFNTSNLTFRQLMGNGLLYAVPRFQRDYSWTDVEWDDLWADLEQVMQPDSNYVHYMGYLVFQSRDSKNFDIIDGQQRLTTLSLFVLGILSALQQLVENGVEPENNRRRMEQLRNTFIGYLDPVTLVPRSKLTLNRNNNAYFQNYLVPLQKLPVRNIKATENLMRQAFEWFRNRIWNTYGSQLSGALLAEVLDRLADRLFFTVITVSDELNAYKVFETLNARGVKLASTDLLKNYFFSVVHQEVNDDRALNHLEERWENVVSKLGNESFPEFLRTYWNSTQKFVRHNELFKTIKTVVKDRQSVFQLVREIETNADVYAALCKPEDSLWNSIQSKYIEELKIFNIKQPFPLLLAAYGNFSTLDFTTLLKACSIITFRYNIISNLPVNEQEKIYTAVAAEISHKKLTSVREVLSALKIIYPDDENFVRAFAEKSIKTNRIDNKKVVKYILFCLEKHLSGSEMETESDLYSLEHILPENPGPGWEDVSDEDHEQFVYRLGNMVLLRKDQNPTLGNATFSEKQDVFLKSALVIPRRIAEHYSTWHTKPIVDTQKWMANQAKTVWKISQL